MTGSQNTRGYERYFAIDTHREYHLVGGQNEDREWVVPPRRVSIEKFPEWAQKTFCAGDVVVLETTTNVWNTYDIVAPLASRVFVANAAAVRDSGSARQDGQGRYQTPAEIAFWRDSPGSVGTARACARVTLLHILSQLSGENGDDDPQPFEQPAA